MLLSLSNTLQKNLDTQALTILRIARIPAGGRADSLWARLEPYLDASHPGNMHRTCNLDLPE